MISAFHAMMIPWNSSSSSSNGMVNTSEVCETSYNPSEWIWVKINASKPSYRNSADTTARAAPSTVSSQTYYALHNKRTEQVYSSFDSSYVVALKCAAAFIATPVYISARIVAHVALLVAYDIGYIVIFHHIKHIFEDVQKKGDSISAAVSEHLSQCITDLILKIGKRVTAIIQCVYYLPGLMTAALGGALIDPYLGRHHYAQIEKKLNNGALRNVDVRIYCTNPEVRGNLGVIFEAAFFLMFSFQPRFVFKHPAYTPYYGPQTTIIKTFRSKEEMEEEAFSRGPAYGIDASLFA